LTATSEHLTSIPTVLHIRELVERWYEGEEQSQRHHQDLSALIPLAGLWAGYTEFDMGYALWCRVQRRRRDAEPGWLAVVMGEGQS